MNHKSLTLMSLLLASALLTAHHGRAAIIVTDAEDDASDTAYNPSWTGNGGTGFDAWVFRNNPASGGAAGQFMATTGGNTDLNNIDTSNEAWGTFANNGGGSGGFQESVAFRGFGFNGTDWDNSLYPRGGVFKVSIENGNVSSGTGDDPVGGAGSTGFVLRNGNVDSGPGNYNTNARFEFSFQGGDANYSIFDNSGKRDTGIPFRDSGLDVEITLTSGDTYIFKAFDSASPTTQLGSTITGTFSGTSNSSIDSVALYNRNAELSNVYFNSLKVQRIIPEPTSFVLVCAGIFLLRFSGRRRRR